ncbi:MAG: hypothetical protein HDT14_05025 [Oscillibacter sp.]|nr:hypothetical protein [Oscillibacter sp.]
MERDTGSLPEKLARQLGRAIACLLLAALLLGLTACGRGQAQQMEPQDPQPEPPTVTDRQPEVQEPRKPEPEPEPEPEADPVQPEPEDEESGEGDGFPDVEEEKPHPTKPKIDFTQEEFDQVVADVLDAVIQDGMTPMEQARAVFDYAHNSIRYVGSSDKSDWVKGAYIGLTTGRGDCFTYYAVSRALLTALEIDNLEVQRIEGAKTHHYWNLVNCGDGWYHFDACPRNLKMPSFLSFMVTDEQIAAFTALAGRNYYDFDDTSLPERATEIITNTRPIPRPSEDQEELEGENLEGEEPGVDSDEPMLPPEDDADGTTDETMQSADGSEPGTDTNDGEPGADANDGEPGTGANDGESGIDTNDGGPGTDTNDGESGADASDGEPGTGANDGEPGTDAGGDGESPDPAPEEGPPPEANGEQEEG